MSRFLIKVNVYYNTNLYRYNMYIVYAFNFGP